MSSSSSSDRGLPEQRAGNRPTPERREVSDQIWSRSTLSVTLAGVLLVEVLAMCFYAYWRITTALRPENLADRVEVTVRENYPKFREEIVRQAKSEAPQLAEQASRELVAATADARRKLESLTSRQLDRGIEEATEFSAEQFQELLQENHAEVERLFVAVEEAPQDVRQIVLDLEADFESQFGVDVQKQAKNVLALHRQLNDKFQRLASPSANLDPQELLERRMIRILRAMEENNSSMSKISAVEHSKGS